MWKLRQGDAVSAKPDSAWSWDPIGRVEAFTTLISYQARSSSP